MSLQGDSGDGSVVPHALDGRGDPAASASAASPRSWSCNTVTGDKIYCVYLAEDEELIRKHARLSGFPADAMSRVVAVIDPTTTDGVMGGWRLRRDIWEGTSTTFMRRREGATVSTTNDLASTRPASESPPPALADQVGKLLGHLGGYVAVRTVEMGLRHGLVDALAASGGDASQAEGLTAEELTAAIGLDPFYVEVWCRAAVASEVVDRSGDRFVLAPHMATALLDNDSPAYVAGPFLVLECPEVFDRFSDRFATGQRTWWDESTPEFIDAVARSGRPFYVRLVPGGLQRVPDLGERLRDQARILDLACGAGFGLVRLARTYPSARLVGVDGDAHSLREAARQLGEEGLTDRVELVHSPVEDIAWTDEFDLVISNISMHECRDIEQTTANVHRALRAGGVFVISDFPFPDSTHGLRTPPGRVMAGIQYFEAQIDDQLLPVTAYLELLPRHGFHNVTYLTLTPMHAVTHGTK